MYISKLFRKNLGIRYYKVERIWVFWVGKFYSLCLNLEKITKKRKAHQFK